MHHKAFYLLMLLACLLFSTTSNASVNYNYAYTTTSFSKKAQSAKLLEGKKSLKTKLQKPKYAYEPDYLLLGITLSVPSLALIILVFFIKPFFVGYLVLGILGLIAAAVLIYLSTRI